jgi:hypothetical protein
VVGNKALSKKKTWKHFKIDFLSSNWNIFNVVNFFETKFNDVAKFHVIVNRKTVTQTIFSVKNKESSIEVNPFKIRMLPSPISN